MLKVTIIEQSQLIRLGLVNLIGNHPKMVVVGQGSCEASTLQGLRKAQPAVVVVNLDDAFSLGLRMVERIQKGFPEMAVLGLTRRIDHPAFARLLELGVKGLLSLGCDASELHEAIFKVSRKEHAISAPIAQRLALSMLPSQATSPFEQLTTREIEVALSLVEGHRMPSIARQLSVSPKTVATYKYRIYEKLNVDTEVALLKLAFLHGLVEMEQPDSQANLF